MQYFLIQPFSCNIINSNNKRIDSIVAWDSHNRIWRLFTLKSSVYSVPKHIKLEKQLKFSNNESSYRKRIGLVSACFNFNIILHILQWLVWSSSCLTTHTHTHTHTRWIVQIWNITLRKQDYDCNRAIYRQIFSKTINSYFCMQLFDKSENRSHGWAKTMSQ
jgi:hypothetical protein